MILADAHVHIYDCFDLKAFLDSAIENFNNEAARLMCNDGYSAVLYLAETSRDNKFNEIVNDINGGSKELSKKIPGWTFSLTGESCSVYARRNDGKALSLIAGRQIVTAEKLEALALGTERNIEDGMPLKKTVMAIGEIGAIPVIPWGTGKWLGYRGEVLRKYMDEVHSTPLFLGDNGGRPWFWSTPSHLRAAEKKGIIILPGSDPLPFSHECSRPGSSGFFIDHIISGDRPAADLKRLLIDHSTIIQPYGIREKTFRFLGNQLRMQELKRKRKKDSY